MCSYFFVFNNSELQANQNKSTNRKQTFFFSENFSLKKASKMSHRDSRDGVSIKKFTYDKSLISSNTNIRSFQIFKTDISGMNLALNFDWNFKMIPYISKGLESLEYYLGALQSHKSKSGIKGLLTTKKVEILMSGIMISPAPPILSKFGPVNPTKPYQ